MEKEFHIVVGKKSGMVVNHTIKFHGIDQDFVDSAFSEADPASEDEKTEDSSGEERSISPFPQDFSALEKAFIQAMSMYQNSVMATIKMAPSISSVLVGMNVERIATSMGEKVDSLSAEDKEVFALPMHAVPEVATQTANNAAVVEGARHLPKISAIGIVSSYDAILSDMLRIIFCAKPEIVFTSEREIKFSDLVSFGSIEAARENIISDEIEGILRQSHHKQFQMMESKFGIKLREGLSVWPDFIELCERRNLLTHTGGVVSEQYLKNCKTHGQKSPHSVGDRLDVDLVYLEHAIQIVSEIGIKLIHTMWRKFFPDDRKKADLALNEHGMNLISAKRYELAQKLLDFGVNQRKHASDKIKRMMAVNLANAAKLNGDMEHCQKVLSAHDWSATSYQFQICVAAVKNDFSEVVSLLSKGKDALELTPSNFRNWPVFVDARADESVQQAFEEVYEEKLLKGEEFTRVKIAFVPEDSS